MGAPAFYEESGEKTEATLKKYDGISNDLDKLYKEWEKALS